MMNVEQIVSDPIAQKLSSGMGLQPLAEGFVNFTQQAGSMECQGEDQTVSFLIDLEKNESVIHGRESEFNENQFMLVELFSYLYRTYVETE